MKKNYKEEKDVTHSAASQTQCLVITGMDQDTTGRECALWMKTELGLSLGISALAGQMG